MRQGLFNSTNHSVIVSLHIPKSGGSMIEKSILIHGLESYRKGKVSNVHKEIFLELSHLKQQKVYVIIGHQSWGIHLHSSIYIYNFNLIII